MDSSVAVNITIPRRKYSGDWWETHQGFNGSWQHSTTSKEGEDSTDCCVQWRDYTIEGDDHSRRLFLGIVSGRLDDGRVVKDPSSISYTFFDLMLDFSVQPNSVLAGSNFQSVWCNLVDIHTRRPVLLDHLSNIHAARPKYPWEALYLRGHTLIVTGVQLNVASLVCTIQNALEVIQSDNLIAAAFLKLQAPPELPRTRIEAAITAATQVRDSRAQKGPDRARMDGVIGTLETLLAMTR